MAPRMLPVACLMLAGGEGDGTGGVVFTGQVRSSYFPKLGITVTVTGHWMSPKSSDCNRTNCNRLRPVRSA